MDIDKQLEVLSKDVKHEAWGKAVKITRETPVVELIRLRNELAAENKAAWPYYKEIAGHIFRGIANQIIEKQWNPRVKCLNWLNKIIDIQLAQLGNYN